MSRDINAYLDAFKQKKERQKERKKAEKKKETKEKQSQQKRVDRLKKELYVQQLIKMHVKPFQKPPEPLKHITIINVGDFDEDNLYTFEELLNIETLYPNETGRINWLYWEELINKTRNEIHNLLKNKHVNK